MPGPVMTEEELKKQNALEAEAAKKAEAAKQQALLVSEDETLSPANFVAKGPAPVLKSLVQAYIDEFKNEKFYKEPISDPTKGACVLTFGTKELATVFFEKQANSGLTFLCQEEGKGFDGHNFFACGDKNLYQGSVQEIMEALSASLAAAEENSELKNTISEGLELFKRATSSHPTKRFRDALPQKEEAPAAPSTPPSPSPFQKN